MLNLNYTNSIIKKIIYWALNCQIHSISNYQNPQQNRQ